MALLDRHIRARVFEKPANWDPLLELPGMTVDMRKFIRLQEQYFKKQGEPFDIVDLHLFRPRQNNRLPNHWQLFTQTIHSFEAIHARTQLAQWFIAKFNFASTMHQQWERRCAILHPVMSFAYSFVDLQLRGVAIGDIAGTTLAAFEAGVLESLYWNTWHVWIDDAGLGTQICLVAADMIRFAVDSIYFMKRNQRAPMI